MSLNLRSLRKLAEPVRKDLNLKELRKRLLSQKPWNQYKSKTDGTSNINTNDFAGSANNEQIRKDNNLTGQVEDASEMYGMPIINGE